MKTTYKICVRCNSRQETSKYYKWKHSKDGYMAACKECISLARKEQYQELKNHARFSVLSHYSGGLPKCACCGTQHIIFLTIDHINGGGNQHRKKINRTAGFQFYKWLIKNNYPKGYRVLCYNCNIAYTRIKYCPHGGII